MCVCWNCLLEIWSCSLCNSNVHVWGQWRETGIHCYWLICLCLLSIGLLTSQCIWSPQRQVVMLWLSNWQAVLIPHCHCIGLHSLACLPRMRSAQLLNCWPFESLCVTLSFLWALQCVQLLFRMQQWTFLRRTYKTFFCLFWKVFTVSKIGECY